MVKSFPGNTFDYENAAKFTVFLRPESLMTNLDRNPVLWRRLRRAAFYNGLKSKVGLAAAKTAAMRINLNIDGCGVVAPPVHSSLHAPHLLANLLAHNLPLPRAAH